MIRFKSTPQYLGIVLLLSMTILLVVGATIAQGQNVTPPPNLGADYVGADRCETCHNNDVAPLWDTWNKTLHAQTIRTANADTLLGDFADSERLTVTWPDGEQRPINPTTDITYVVGGRYTQQYITVMDRNEGETGYFVLPIVWNIAQEEGQTSQWTVVEGDDWLLPENDWRVTCAGCHSVGYSLEADAATMNFDFVADFTGHALEIGINCESCHGPAGDHNGGRGDLPLSPDAQVCGQCHAQGHAPDSTSPFPVGYQPGLDLLDETIFVLTDQTDTTVWWPTGHARSSGAQYNEWLLSGHANALESVLDSDYADDSCLRCHSAPADATDITPDTVATLETAQFGVTCVACHNPHPSESEPQEPPTLDSSTEEKLPASHTADFIAANGGKRDQGDDSDGEATDGEATEEAPPVYALEPAPYLLKADDTYALCTSCHNSQTEDGEALLVGGMGHHPTQEMFEGQQVIDSVNGVVSGHFSSENGPECIDCHMPATAPIGEFGAGRSHLLDASLPDNNSQESSCDGCHSDLSPGYLQRFVTNMQTNTAERLHEIDFVLSRATGTEQWVLDAISFVVGDGSLGVHNYAYTDALLNEVEIALGIYSATNSTNGGYVNQTHLENPATCEECHRDEMHNWQGSPHALSSSNDNFLKDFASQGRPTYCMNCHASGYDPKLNTYEYEGVVCSRCHTLPTGAEHPPAPISVADTPELCGQCHSGAHAPTYDEWLASDHRTAGVDCVDCHTPHDNGLILGDVNTTCGDCHQEAIMDDVHMGDDMSCVDCHLTLRTTDESGHVLATGHTMAIDPGVCAECHGNTHLLSARDYNRTPEEIAAVEALETQIVQLEETTDENRYANIVGGALGMLIMLIALYLLNRLRRFI